MFESISDTISTALGDCLDILPSIPEGSIDAILTDLPFQITRSEWDLIIPFNKYIILDNEACYYQEALQQLLERGCTYQEFKLIWESEKKEGMWQQVKRVLKPSGVFVTSASQPFTSKLVLSNLEMFKYCWVWEKSHATGFLDCKKKPMKQHEDIVVFYDKQCTYNPQMYKKDPAKIRNGKKNPEVVRTTDSYNSFKDFVDRSVPEDVGYPLSIQYFATPYKGQGNKAVGGLHPTQKPVELYEYLIRTYTNPGDTVLDFCMGSGTTGEACKNLNRRFIGIEKEQKYYDIAKERLLKCLQQQSLFNE
jgi:site-specific DNA-methyltransferase (adenine-specific)